MDKNWTRIAVLAAILGAAGLGIRYGKMQGRATGPQPAASSGSVEPDEGAFDVLPAAAVRCDPAGSLCVAPGDNTTISAGTAAIAGRLAAPPPRLRREGVSDEGASKNNAPWTVRLEAQLARPALAGNAIITVADANEVAAGYVTAMRQAKVPAGSSFAARLRLSPIDGVLPGRLYHIRIVQLIDHNEQLLAQGDVQLD